MENKRHKALAIRKTVVAQALAVAFGAVAFSGGMVTTAYAQSNATGTIFSRVEAGSVVTIENVGTGLKRTLTADATGRVTFTSLPTGMYKATLTRNGAAAGTQDGIEVLLGQGSEVSFGAKTLQTVQVVGQRTRIDVSNTNNGASFTAKELASIPAVRNVDSIIQLAPNTTRADSRYAGGASIGGGGPSENAYYINGFPVTNALTQLGGSELPFGAIAQAQVLTGGFGAEFGRSVGGVVNVVTKSGTNNWEAGVQVSVVPASLRSKAVDLNFPTGTGAASDGTLRLRRSENTNTETKLGAFLSGPLIEDKLLMFVAVEQTKNDIGRVVGLSSTSAANNNLNGWVDETAKTTRFLGKLDWNLTNDHRLEWTSIGDRPELTQSSSGYNYATNTRNGIVSSGAYYKNIDNFTAQGADTNILKYTGDLTSDVTLTALIGQSKSPHTNAYSGYDASIKGVTFSSAASRAPGVTYPVLNPISGQTILSDGAEDTVKGYRVDLEWRLNPQHTLRFGIDDNKLSSAGAGNVTAGGGTILYTNTSAANVANPNFTPAQASRAIWLGNPAYGALANAGYYGREQLFTTTTDAYSDQAAQYVEDKFQATKNLLLTFGLRHETYENRNGDGQVFLKNDQVNPRFAAAWDVNGDSSLKLYGSAGRYSLQIPTHIAVRGASRSLFTRQFFIYTGVDANGQPTGRVNVTDPLSSNNEYGQAKDYQSVSSTDLAPTYQDELTLGFEKALTPAYNGGVKVTYRKLQSTIDDFCDFRPFDTWAAKNNVDTSNYRGFGCASINPGKDQSFLIDFNDNNPDLTKRGKFTKVALSAADIGLPNAERTYTAVDLFLEHPLRNGWYGKVNYTWSQSKGNTEGQTLSDVAQTDVAATQTWDHPELMEGAYGLLPNDRTHQIKAYGFYELSPQWQVGANVLLASGRPKNCIGYYAGNSATQHDVDYGAAYRYCDGKPTPRGSEGTLPWDKRLDLSVAYKPSSVKGLELKADVTNVFNEQTVQTIDEVYNNNADNAISVTYGRTISTTPPRSVRLTATYNYKF